MKITNCHSEVFTSLSINYVLSAVKQEGERDQLEVRVNNHQELDHGVGCLMIPVISFLNFLQ